MNKKRINKSILKKNEAKLPLVLCNAEVTKKNIEISGKSIQVLKYKTNFFPIDSYYKPIIRMIE